MPDSLLTVSYLPVAERNLEYERELLLLSGIFDAAAYVGVAGIQAREDPIGHYLEKGWLGGLDPNPAFPGSLFQPYFAAIGSREPPAITWLALRSAGWPLPGTRSDVAQSVSIIRESGYFDELFYAGQAGETLAGLDPYIHYLAVGERLGFSPSPGFDPVYYRQRYPDIVQASIVPLIHFVSHGLHEGRRGCSPEKRLRGGVVADPTKENILLFIHEASRTGAPILGWNIASHLARKYNIYTVFLGGGDLRTHFEAVSVEMYSAPGTRLETDIEFSIRRLLDEYQFRYALVNSVESRFVLESCVRRIIPTVLLVHEFATYVHTAASLRIALDWSSEVVFPAHLVAQAAVEVHPPLCARRVHILPQGQSIVPGNSASEKEDANPILEELIRRHDQDGVFVVLGAGSVQIRKGIDLFLASAAAVKRARPDAEFVFAWIGHGFRPQDDMGYSIYLKEQMNRSGVDSQVVFVPEVTNLDSMYRIADVFFLSSRLDPMPNVSIDAAVRGIPIVCFKDASGTSELLLSDPETARGVVDHLNAEEAARVILDLFQDEYLRRSVSDATRRLATKAFNMPSYVAALDAVGTTAANRCMQRKADAKILLDDSAFDQNLLSGLLPTVESRREAILRYLAISGARGWRNEAAAKDTRRPAPGFNPLIYTAHHLEELAGGIDPFAHFIRSGKPAGPWQATVLTPEDPVARSHSVSTLRLALHAHLFYPELTGDLLAHLDSNQSRCDLLVSTDTPAKVTRLRRSLSAYTRGNVEIRLLPNKGRDIGALLTGFAGDLSNYDLVGHVHSKRSPLIDEISNSNLSETWREFLWQNLLGGSYPMLDRIAAAFENDSNLGLVFPCDPHLRGWDENRVIAGDIAPRMGWKGALPDAFDFPLGTMFYVRPAALEPLLRLRFDWSDYPDEPIPYDGTILHALERLIPMTAQLAGYSCAVTHIFGKTW